MLLHNNVKKTHRLSICRSNSINQPSNGARPELFGCLTLDAKEKSLTTCLHLWPHKLWIAKHWFTLARHVKSIYFCVSTLFTSFSISLQFKIIHTLFVIMSWKKYPFDFDQSLIIISFKVRSVCYHTSTGGNYDCWLLLTLFTSKSMLFRSGKGLNKCLCPSTSQTSYAY